jgi:hypothetical protein
LEDLFVAPDGNDPANTRHKLDGQGTLGEAIIHVTRGTSKLKKSAREFKDLIVEKPEELKMCGLTERPVLPS